MSIEANLLYNTIAGRGASLVEAQAVNLLQSPNLLDNVRAYQLLLENDQESLRIRHQAIANLSKINRPESQQILIDNLRIGDDRLRADLLKGLGRIGDERALAIIEQVRPETTGLAAFNAQFAAALISHRLGLPGNDLPVPPPDQFLRLPPDDAQQFQVAAVDPSEAELCLSSLESQPFGIRYAADSLRQIQCGRNRWMLVCNQDFAQPDAVQRMQTQKAFPGIIALKSEENGRYATAFLLLTTPGTSPDTLNLLIPRSTGEILFSGIARIVGDRVEFAIASVEQPGAFPIEVQGTFSSGRVDFSTALSATRVQSRQQPQKG